MLIVALESHYLLPFFIHLFSAFASVFIHCFIHGLMYSLIYGPFSASPSASFPFIPAFFSMSALFKNLSYELTLITATQNEFLEVILAPRLTSSYTKSARQKPHSEAIDCAVCPHLKG